MDDNERNGLQEIIDAVLDEMARESGGPFDPSKVNLADFSRRTGLSRSKARTLKERDFKATPHGRYGMRAQTTVLTGFTGVLDELLQRGVTNSEVCFERIAEQGYEGGLTSVKTYIKAHDELVPAKRKMVEPQGNRGRRFQTGPGEAYQMDWGFTEVEDWEGRTYRMACFVMVCHHCGTCHIEFFTSARQENLFIGMLHAFMAMGVPEYVLTDNMKSVVIRRDLEGHPVWQSDYAAFMACVGFKTKLCKPRHPYTKGKVERLVRFVKGNFLAGRAFSDIAQLNEDARVWCISQGSRYRKAVDCIPADEHGSACSLVAGTLDMGEGIAYYLCPRRSITFDGFVSYEGHRFGVPYWYSGKTCRVSREGGILHVYSEDLSLELAAHAMVWGHGDSFCTDQYADVQPCELPTAPVRTTIAQLEPAKVDPAFAKFDFEGMV